MNKQDYINLLFEKFQSCQIDRKQLEQCFEVVLKEVRDPVLAFGNLQALLWMIFREESAFRTRRKSRSEQFWILNKKQSPFLCLAC